MPSSSARPGAQPLERIDVSAFRNIQICFPGDVYVLAVWLVMADRAKSTATTTSRTTLRGLACHFTRLCDDVRPIPLSVDAVLAVFRKHGITGNPVLSMESEIKADAKLLTMG